MPVISPELATIAVESMSCLEYYPAESAARAAISAELSSMCKSEDEVKWLVRRMIRLYTKWPGIMELRRVYCSTHPPLDAIEPTGASEFYPDGIPSESYRDLSPQRLIGLRNEDGKISGSSSAAAGVRRLARAKSFHGERR
jgi:hypothetical protein